MSGVGCQFKRAAGSAHYGSHQHSVQNIRLSNIVAISAGNEHCMALDNHGRVWAWGDNYYGQLGNSSVSRGTIESYSVVPVQFLNLDSITVAAIYTGLQNSVLLTDSGTVYSIGYNGDGVLGNGIKLIAVCRCSQIT
jgi:alpha-tubulin suppressor-like RCC1 family protein